MQLKMDARHRLSLKSETENKCECRLRQGKAEYRADRAKSRAGTGRVLRLGLTGGKLGWMWTPGQPLARVMYGGT